jgi:sugar phosphate isomerase/epimerase
MDEKVRHTPATDRRSFLKKTAGAGLAGAGVLLNPRQTAAVQTSAAQTHRVQPLTEKAALDRIASNSYPLRSLFRTRSGGRGGGRGGAAAAGAGQAGQTSGAGQQTATGGGRGAAQVPGRGMGGVTPQQMREKYGEITMLEFPQFTKDTFPGVIHMDVWSSLFGDVTDDSMYGPRGFDPSTPSSRRWLERLASMLAKTGTTIHHISNNAPTGMSGPDEEARRAGLEVAKKWLDGAAIIGAKSMRVNSGGPSYLPNATKGPDGYPKNEEIVPYLRTCIESFKEMADYGGKVGVKVTLENHWGLTANPANMLIILDEVNHPFCEASPDYANWEHEYMLFSGLRAVAPYAHTTVHAKYWDRWTNNDLQRSTRIMMASGFEGKYALEYESGPWDGVEGVRYLLKEVMAALTSGAGNG